MRIYASNLILLGLAGTYAIAAFSAICTLANIPYCVGLGAGNVAMLLASLFFSEEDRKSETVLVRIMIAFSFCVIVGVTVILECFSSLIILQYFEANAPIYSIALLGFRLFMPEMIPCCLNTVMKHQDVDPAAHIGIRMIMKTVKDANYVNSFGLNNLTLII